MSYFTKVAGMVWVSVALFTSCVKEKENVIPPEVEEVSYVLPAEMSRAYILPQVFYRYSLPQYGSDSGQKADGNNKVYVEVSAGDKIRLQFTLGDIEVNEELIVIHKRYAYKEGNLQLEAVKENAAGNQRAFINYLPATNLVTGVIYFFDRPGTEDYLVTSMVNNIVID